MNTEIRIKAMYFDELIAEVQRVRDMYVCFSKEMNNAISRSDFQMIAKDLNTIINKYSDK